jgi:hypothetical protein
VDRNTKHLQAFLLLIISINKGVDYDRQQTGNKSGEQTSPFFFLTQLSVQSKRKTAATVSLFEIPGCFADVLWLKAKVDSRFFHEEKEQTYVWNPLLLLFCMGNYG